MKVTMIYDRSTPGAHLYREVDAHGRQISTGDSNIGQLYVRKSSELGKDKPSTITVEVLPAST